MIKVLIVDDSAFMRKALSTLLAKDETIEVVGTARDGEDALVQIPKLDPDVITLDIEMPKLDGLTTLQRIMKEFPRPVIMVSSLTESGADATLKALDYGALDYIPKSLNSDQQAFASELTTKVRAVARRRAIMQLRFSRQKEGAAHAAHAPTHGHAISASGVHTPTAAGAAPRHAPFTPCKGPRDIVAIGVSTGGPPCVQKILSSLPADFPACILIAQHMPAAFTGPFAKRLDGVSKITVTEAKDGDPIKPGHAYVCPGGKHISLRAKGALMDVMVSTEPTTALYKPTANVLFESVGNLHGRKSAAIILTGMGNDGVEGMKIFKEKGGYVLAQNEQSCVVYGMPKAVVDAGLADQILDVDHIADALITAVKG